MTDVGTASQPVGHLSASQFSREYSRFFGSAPAKDIARLRQETGVGGDGQEVRKGARNLIGESNGDLAIAIRRFDNDSRHPGVV
jgi:hypothetical protein